MNSDKRNNGGNAVIYILLALALLGGLTMVLARQNTTDSGQDLSKETTELLSTRLVAYAGSAKNTVDQMMFSGTPVANLNYTRPDQAAFDTPPNINKVFHPDGGGLSIDAVDTVVFSDTGTTPKAGWYMGRFNNFEWTKTTAQDIVLVAFGINQPICANINKKITGSATIPAIGNAGNIAQYFVATSITGVANADFTSVAGVCAPCKGFPAMCVSNQAGTQWAYYNIISGQ